MAFFHDIHRIKNEDGSISVIEVEYSQEECIRRGWFDSEKCQWVREYVAPPDSNPDLFQGQPPKDTFYGTVMTWILESRARAALKAK